MSFDNLVWEISFPQAERPSNHATVLSIVDRYFVERWTINMLRREVLPYCCFILTFIFIINMKNIIMNITSKICNQWFLLKAREHWNSTFTLLYTNFTFAIKNIKNIINKIIVKAWEYWISTFSVLRTHPLSAPHCPLLSHRLNSYCYSS